MINCQLKICCGYVFLLYLRLSVKTTYLWKSKFSKEQQKDLIFFIIRIKISLKGYCIQKSLKRTKLSKVFWNIVTHLFCYIYGSQLKQLMFKNQIFSKVPKKKVIKLILNKFLVIILTYYWKTFEILFIPEEFAL